MPEMPKRVNNSEDYKSLHCVVPKDKSFISICIMDDKDNDLSDILKVLSKYPGTNIEIKNITTLKQLNVICSLLGAYDYSGNVTINILSRLHGNNAYLKGLTNNKVVNLEALPCYAKINGFYKNNSQSDFTSWAHNLNYNDRNTLLNCLTDDCKSIFLEQERVIKSFYNDLIKEYPYIMNLDEKSRLETVFEYLSKNIRYANVLGPDGLAKLGYEYTHDAVETYKRHEGVCNGRANLLALVTNNNLLKINSAVVDGYTEPHETAYNRSLPHTWNVFVDENGNAQFYDLSFRQFTGRDIHDLGERSITNVYYSNVKDILDIPTLPPRRKSYRPLPKRREGQ
jgi:hypothetical protein